MRKNFKHKPMDLMDFILVCLTATMFLSLAEISGKDSPAYIIFGTLSVIGMVIIVMQIFALLKYTLNAT